MVQNMNCKTVRYSKANTLVMSSKPVSDCSTYAMVDTSCCIQCLGPGESDSKDAASGFVFSVHGVSRLPRQGWGYSLLFQNCRGHRRFIYTAEISLETWIRDAKYIGPDCTSIGDYFGSHCTYPLVDPLTSLTTTSKASKSRAVTASKATSKRISAHSKKA